MTRAMLITHTHPADGSDAVAEAVAAREAR